MSLSLWPSRWLGVAVAVGVGEAGRMGAGVAVGSRMGRVTGSICVPPSAKVSATDSAPADESTCPRRVTSGCCQRC
ncbi:MAG: hypothetical protein MUE40_15720 [Anaerolineae bacterium]|nr:hypothetical protein [Anaerolineae bacterium]